MIPKRVLELKIVLTDTNQIASLETRTGLDEDKVEDNLIIIGILENIKQKHLDKLKTQFTKTVKEKDGNNEGC